MRPDETGCRAIGFTDEHPLHLATTRLWAWREEYSSDHEWAARLAERPGREHPGRKRSSALADADRDLAG
jgi:hypothetical protein